MGKSRNIRNKELGDAMRELRQGSRTTRHRMRNRVERQDWRRIKQSGRIEL